jgi:DNA-directed RNA polymerase specialized sigma24 family protein
MEALDSLTRKAIVDLFGLGWKGGDIARVLSISERSVRRFKSDVRRQRSEILSLGDQARRALEEDQPA